MQWFASDSTSIRIYGGGGWGGGKDENFLSLLKGLLPKIVFVIKIQVIWAPAKGGGGKHYQYVFNLDEI